VRGDVPAGVATHFLDVLAADQRSARARSAFAAVLVAGMAVPAWFLFPWEGVAVHFAAAFVGVVAGVLFARSRTRRYEASIRTTWTQWMRFAVSAESVAEVHRKVRGRPGRNLPYIYAAVLFGVWGLEVGLLVLAFLEDAPAELAAPVIALNGLLAGFLLGHFLVTARWFAGFRRSVSELVDSGEIGMWGVM
jgi:hypothetical protein